MLWTDFQPPTVSHGDPNPSIIQSHFEDPTSGEDNPAEEEGTTINVDAIKMVPARTWCLRLFPPLHRDGVAAESKRTPIAPRTVPTHSQRLGRMASNTGIVR